MPMLAESCPLTRSRWRVVEEIEIEIEMEIFQISGMEMAPRR